MECITIMKLNFLTGLSRFAKTQRRPKRLSPTLSLLLLLFSSMNNGYASNRYFLCGPDEDGCYEEISQYCACIPYDDLEAGRPYCLNFNEMTCTPLSQTPNCDPAFIFQNQGSCLATIYQSEPRPPCSVTTRSYCLEHHTSICDKNGRPESCHPEM